MSITRSVPTWLMAVTRLVRSDLRKRVTKADGAAAVERAKLERWHRYPESTISCSRCSGFANLKRKMRCPKCQPLAVLKDDS